MHMTLEYTPAESELSTPSDTFDFSTTADLQEAWSSGFFTMAEHNYSDHFGRLLAPSQDWTPSSAVSSFNLPLVYDSTLTTPVSLRPESPNPHGKGISGSPSGRGEYHSLRSNESMYINTTSISMKSKNETLMSSASDADNMLSISPYVYDSPPSPCPPTPRWTPYAVSTPEANNASTATTTTTPNLASSQNMSNASGNRSQAPILIAPNPSSLRPRHNSQDSDPTQKQRQSVQPIHLTAQAPQHRQVQAQSAPVKHEHASPAPPAKRRKRSAPPVEQSKPLTKDDISEEDKILLHLRDIKDEKKWDWKELADQFNAQTGGKHNVAALQMRHTRLVERMRVWTDVEIRALNRAKVLYDNQRWKSVADNMIEYGCQTKWSPHACQMKWQELHPNDDATYFTTSDYLGTDNATTALPPHREDSSISIPEEDDGGKDAAEGRALTPNMPSGSGPRDQAQRLQIRQRKRGSSSRSASVGRASKNVYEQKHEWTISLQQLMSAGERRRANTYNTATTIE